MGWQQAIALAAMSLSIPLIAAIPFDGQDKLWNDQDRERWETILFQSQKIIHVDRLPEYHAEDDARTRKRDEWMIDNCDLVLALEDEGSSIIEYAESQGKAVFNVWKSWLKYGNR